MNFSLNAALSSIAICIGVTSTFKYREFLSQKYPNNWERPTFFLFDSLSLQAWLVGLLSILIFFNLVKVFLRHQAPNVALSTLTIGIFAPVLLYVSFMLWIIAIAPGLNWLRTSDFSSETRTNSYVLILLGIIVSVGAWLLMSAIIGTFPTFHVPQFLSSIVLGTSTVLFIILFFAQDSRPFDHLPEAIQHQRAKEFFGDSYTVAYNILNSCNEIEKHVKAPEYLRPYSYWRSWKEDTAPMVLRDVDGSYSGKYRFLYQDRETKGYVELTVTLPKNIGWLGRRSSYNISPVTIYQLDRMSNESGPGKLFDVSCAQSTENLANSTK